MKTDELIDLLFHRLNSIVVNNEALQYNRFQGFKDSKHIIGTSSNYKKHRIKIIIKKTLLQNVITHPH